MFLANASVRRPVAMAALIIGLSLLGLRAYHTMGLELLPKMDIPYITISTVYPGASPEQIETDIAKRIEDQVVSIDGLKHVSSVCMENVCQTLLEFHLEVDVDIAATDVREKLDLIADEFPADVEEPKILKFDVNAKPIINLALTGAASLDDLYDYADNALRDKVTVIPGVANMEIIGGAEREVHVMLDRSRLAARGLSSLHVVQALQQGVGTIPSGHVRENGTEYAVEFYADYDEVGDIGGLEVANADGKRCTISDIGRVEMATEEVREKAFLDGRPCVAIKVVKKSDANAVDVVGRVRKAVDRLNDEALRLKGMELVWVSDDGSFIEAQVKSAWLNIGQGILLTGVILFLFLYNLRSTLVVAVTMPLTVLIGLFFIQLLGYTVNIATLLATGMSVGILVTNSIVVLEAITKRLDEIGDAKAAARQGAGEAAVAVLASAGTNVVVLFPIALTGGMVGLFIKPFALTMAVMTAVSLFISFTLTPLLCSIALKPRRGGRETLLGRVEARFNRILDGVVHAYGVMLDFFDRRRWVAALLLAATSLLFVFSLSSAGRIGFSFAEDCDEGVILAKLEYPTHFDLEHTVNRVQEIDESLADLPGVHHVLSTVGRAEGVVGQISRGVYVAQILLKFSDRDQRSLSIQDLIAEVRRRLDGYQDCIVTVSLPAGPGGQASDVELDIAGEDLETLDSLALRTRDLSRAIPGVSDADTSVRPGKPKLKVHPRRAVLSDLGIPAVSLGLTLRANLEGLDAGTYKKGDRNYDIVAKLEEEEGMGQVGEFLFPGAPGHSVLLANFGEVEETIAPIQITRKDKSRVSKLFANLDSRKPLGTAVDEISLAIDSRADLPAGYEYSFGGLYEIMTEGQRGLAEAGVIAVVLVVLTLAAILESFKQPVLILVTLPLGLIGVLLSLLAAGHTMTMFVLMSIVMLIGIVVNNAILVMDQFNLLVKDGFPRHKAMVTAASQRFRPIVMITLAAVLGMLPMALGRGIGAEMRNAVGIASAGGILVSGVLTLFVMPVVYNLFVRRDKDGPASHGQPT